MQTPRQTPTQTRGSSPAAAALLVLLLALGGCAHAPGPLEPDAVSLQVPVQLSAVEAARLLEQSSFGPTPEQVERVRRQGVQAYVAEQLRLRNSSLPKLAAPEPPDATRFCSDEAQAAQCRRMNFSVVPVQQAMLHNALNQPDQLRQRMAFALSQLVVVSARRVNQSYAIASYQTLLLEHALGNYRELLEAVTLHPLMGQYLDMANNRRQASPQQPAPNENYARELLQLFSIGPVKLNLDGTAQRNAQGQPLPSYGQDDIRALARVFTGWTYPPRPNVAPAQPGKNLSRPAYYAGPLEPVPELHDSAPKTVLGHALPGQTDPRAELRQALDVVFAHPNIGPFVSRHLIEQLVTGEPEPAYVARVATVFNNNGQGVRGDLAAVVRAILLDPAARQDPSSQPRFGKLRDPVLYITRVLRALPVSTDGLDMLWQFNQMGQPPFNPPTVFSFYPSQYLLSDNQLNAPEMALLNETSALHRSNFVWRLVFGEPVAPDAQWPGAIGTRLDLSRWEPLAAQPAELVATLDEHLLQGRLGQAGREAVVQALQTVPAAQARQRVRTAVYLLASSPAMQIQR